ncbi:MAG: hypothetical protein KC410_19620 [Anaerolineales bacterium]|nr:hypothetical protein [Anaerolineales bacterium]
MTTFGPVQVAADNRDGWENVAGAINGTAGNDPSIGALTSGNFWAGFGFTSVTVPQGATVDAASTLELYILTTTNDDLVANFHCQAADNAGAFTTTTNDISNRPRTTNYQAVNATSIGANTWYAVTGSGLAAAMTEVFIRPGWTSGNALVFILDAQSGIAFGCHDYGGGSSNAARLTIVYSVGGGSKLQRVRLTTRVGGILTA